ncbi:MAG: DNA mismatch repair protein MutS, partial [Alphaproteobacteria bacterium]|nr:DNA mismatch repair protein MutS [Alphaproteobacteria bacterium]
RSYGLHVARMAGLPRAVLTRAEAILKTLETGESGTKATANLAALPLFSHAITTQEPAPATKVTSPLSEAIAALNPDDLSPKEALETLYHLKEIAIANS